MLSKQSKNVTIVQPSHIIKMCQNVGKESKANFRNSPTKSRSYSYIRSRSFNCINMF